MKKKLNKSPTEKEINQSISNTLQHVVFSLPLEYLTAVGFLQTLFLVDLLEYTHKNTNHIKTLHKQ